MPFFVNQGDTNLTSLLKGGLVGGLSVAGILALSRMRNYVDEEILEEKNRIFPSPMTFRNVRHSGGIPPMNKTSAETNPWTKNFLYGLGLTLGAYGTYQITDEIRKREEKYRTREDIRRFYQSLMKESELSSNRYVNDFIDGYYDEMVKCAQTPQENAGLGPELIDLFKGLGQKVGDTTKFIFVDFPLKYGPIAYGALAGLGGMMGYHGTELMFRPKDVLKRMDPLSSGLKLRFEMKDTEGLFPTDSFLPNKTFRRKQDVNALDTPGLGKSGKLETDIDENAPIGLLGSISKKLTGATTGQFSSALQLATNEKARGSLIQDIVDKAEESVQKKLRSPKMMGTAIGLGSAFALPSIFSSVMNANDRNKNMNAPMGGTNNMNSMYSRMEKQRDFAHGFRG